MSDFKTDFIRECGSLIRSILEPIVVAAAQRKPNHWLSGGNSDAGLSYCSDCIDKAVSIARSTSPKNAEDIFADGGWATEEDSFSFCEICNEPLNVLLTDYGAISELDHFYTRLDQLSCITDLSADEAYELDIAIATARDWTPDNSSYASLTSFLRKAMRLLPKKAA